MSPHHTEHSEGTRKRSNHIIAKLEKARANGYKHDAPLGAKLVQDDESTLRSSGTDITPNEIIPHNGSLGVYASMVHGSHQMEASWDDIQDDVAPPSDVQPAPQIFDVVIIGAGISGINSAYHVQRNLPHYTYTILEARRNMGGTWDLMRYPGIRSDSDLHTFGFSWKPWTERIPIASGPAIRSYLQEAARERAIDEHIMYQHKVKKASWSSREQAWTFAVDAGQKDGITQPKLFKSRFVILGTGYYNYDKPLETHIPGLSNFHGTVVHPQFWPADLTYTDKRIAVIGSGATAITLIPALVATGAGQVTMVQRSPSYVASLTNRVAPLKWWERMLPTWALARLNRWKYLLWGYFRLKYMQRHRDWARRFLRDLTAKQLPEHVPLDPHFNPRYLPWEQRLGLTPDGDFFDALKSRRAGVVTGVIKTVDAEGIEMECGERLDADIIVTATGLRLEYGGNAEFSVDGERVEFGEKYWWRGCLIQDMPNLGLVMGYTNASWTPGADCAAVQMCRLMRYLDSKGMASATPRRPEGVSAPEEKKMQGMSSTYIQRAFHRVPKSAGVPPWRERSSYFYDMFDARFGSLTKGMQFTTKPR